MYYATLKLKKNAGLKTTQVVLKMDKPMGCFNV